MQKKLLLMLSCVLVFCLTGSTLAVNVWWYGADDDGDWFNGNNYSNSAVPLSDTGVNWSVSGLSKAPIDISSGAALCSSLWSYNESNTHTTMTISGGSITGTGYLLTGTGSLSGKSTFYLEDGTITFPRVIVGHNIYSGATDKGYLHMTGGTLNATSSLELHKADSLGQLNLYGGTINAGVLYMDTGHLLDITEGVMYLDGDQTDAGDDLQTWITDDWIIAYGGAGTVMSEYNFGSDQTKVWGIPEPATIALLGLGGLVLMRKRKTT
ncbi:MAG: PEP-CTERM sorting domain-containing protein [Sedimentisphaerales bacterium]|nr:PEP-CTERM sorting domain-containing protein [Sedimentisphaerales bacterium]